MVLPKSTVHVSRLAGTALKSFTHGYAQTVVAASQSSYASQNTPVAPLASNFLSRFKDSNNKPGQHVHFTTNAAGQQTAETVAVKHDGHHDAGLAHYQEAWQKHHKTESREWHHLPLAKRIGWKPPTTIPEPQDAVTQLDLAPAAGPGSSRPSELSTLKRSYSTSAVDNFAKAIDNEEAEAIAIDQVNESLTEEISRQKDTTYDASATAEGLELAIAKPAPGDSHARELQRLLADGQYASIPAVFEAMLRSGVAIPSLASYRALLSSAIELTNGLQHKVARTLDIYSDMMGRGVSPDQETLSLIVDVLAARALEATTASAAIAEKHRLFGPLASTFGLDELEHRIASQDQALDIAMRFIATSVSSAVTQGALEDLIVASATRGALSHMQELHRLASRSSSLVSSKIYPAMIKAFGKAGDLRRSVDTFDEYRNLAIANNAGDNNMARIDQDVYASLVSAYAACNNIEGGKSLLAKVDADEARTNASQRSRDSILLSAVLPYEISKGNFEDVYAIVNSLSRKAYNEALEVITKTSAALDQVVESSKAFDALVEVNAVSTKAAIQMMTMHLRLSDAEASERYWRLLELSPTTLEIMELGVLRALSFISTGQVMQGLRPLAITFSRYRDATVIDGKLSRDSVDRIEEGIEAISRAILSGGPGLTTPDASAELMRIMSDNGTFFTVFAAQALSSLSADQISVLTSPDLDLFTQVQATLICDESYHDSAAVARFTCLLETATARSVLPDVKTENAIEKVLVKLQRPDLNQLWSRYRYPVASPVTSGRTASVPSTFVSHSPTSTATPPSVYEDSFDPYLAHVDHKGSVVITDILERPNGRPGMVLSEAMTKFRNIRRAGRHPRFFAYGKLIQGAARAERLDTAREVLEMAKQDVPYLAQYRIVRHGWISILDSMVAACINAGRRDMAAKYHQDLLELGAAPSANTFGLYITSLKETTKTFDEASEAVKIFLRSKSEGVEPTSFLYNALIGKLGKARRIDDCLFYFAEMRQLGIRPTSVTYGTIVNALCRVSDEKFAEEIFEEMESSTNYKPRPAPYHSLMQFFLTTKREKAKVLSYYERMSRQRIEPTPHTFKLLIDAHATLSPIDMPAAEAVLTQMRRAGVQPEAVHYASLIHAKGCVASDLPAAQSLFDTVVSNAAIRPQPCVYQALFESLVANRAVKQAGPVLEDMKRRGVEYTPYIANALIHGWTLEKDLNKAREAFEMVGRGKREPSTYEAMVRAHLAVEDREGAEGVVREALGRGYPGAVAGKIAELLGGGRA